MDDYLRGLAADLSESWSTSAARREVIADIEPIKLCTDKAVAIGMIANEWVSNACKYAYGDEGDGSVRISLRGVGESMLELAVEDDGVDEWRRARHLAGHASDRGHGADASCGSAVRRAGAGRTRNARQHLFAAAPKRPPQFLIASASAIFRN